jgi:hypothetical protein
MAKKTDIEENLVEENVAPVKEVKPKPPTKAELSQKEADAVDFTQDQLYGDGPWPVISRAAAVILGFSRYYTGEICKNGHDAPRKTKTSTCTACGRMKLRDRHKKKMQEDADYRAKFNEKAKAKRLAKKEAKAVPAE